ncbi:Transposon Ty3-G Gag-Pol poly, partial [Paramuricea clavata]
MLPLPNRSELPGLYNWRNGIMSDPSKIEAIQSWPEPRNVAELRSFLGLCSHNCRFVKSFADKVQSLNQLLKQGTPFKWTEECQTSWETLKRCLTSTPVLSYPCPEEDLILDNDASNVGLGAVLLQTQDGVECVIGYYSRTLNKAERNYCATRKEFLAVVSSVKHFYHFLYGRHFVIRTDHSAMQWLVSFKDVQGQLTRWLQNLQQYDFTIVHRAENHPEEESSRLATLTPQFELSNGDNIVPDTIKKLQAKGADIGSILKWLNEDTSRPEWPIVAPCSEVTKTLWAQWDSLCIHGGCVCRVWENTSSSAFHYQLLVPRDMRKEILMELHGTQTTGHFGINETIQRLKQRFYWPRCQTDVKTWIKECDACLSRKGPRNKQKAPLQLYTVGAPMERIAIGIMSPLPVSKN